MTDAFGHKMRKGSIYGYSKRENGIVTIVIGTYMEDTESSVKLCVLHRGSAVYSGVIKKEEIKRDWVVVASNTLFPINDFTINWKE